MLKRTAEEQAAISRGDREGAVAAFKYMQDRFQKTSNEAKNAGLYVDFKEGQFIAPTERITEVMVAETATLNRDFLSAIGPELRMLNKWNTAPQDFQKQIVAFAELAEAVKAKSPVDQMKAIKELTAHFLEIERGKRGQKPEN